MSLSDQILYADKTCPCNTIKTHFSHLDRNDPQSLGKMHMLIALLLYKFPYRLEHADTLVKLPSACMHHYPSIC